MAAVRRTGTRADGSRHRPPPKIFLALGTAFLALNHLSVLLNNGLLAEAVVMGCWLAMMGGWAGFAGRSFDAVWGWADPSDRRMIGLAFATLAAAIAAAEGVAWFGYGQHLFA